MHLIPENKQQIVGGFNRRKEPAFSRAFDWIYKHHQPKVTSIIDVITKRSFETEDLTVRVFNSLLEHTDRFENMKKIRDFLNLTAMSISLDFMKKQKVIRINAEQIRRETPATEECTMEEVETAAHFRSLVYQEIDKLPAQCKEVFMHWFDGELSNSQIAQIMQISEKTVANQKAIALKKLKMEIAPKARFLFSLIFCL